MIRLPTRPSLEDINRALREMDRAIDELRGNFLTGERRERGNVDMGRKRLSGLRDAARDDDAMPKRQATRDFAPSDARYLVLAANGTLTQERVLTPGTGIGGADGGAGSTYTLSNTGVLSVAKSGSTALTGAVTLSAGANVTLSQVGQDISIAAAGSGDVVGPASAVDSNFASFDTTTGKLLKDSGSKAADFATAAHTHSDVISVARGGFGADLSAATGFSYYTGGVGYVIAGTGTGSVMRATGPTCAFTDNVTTFRDNADTSKTFQFQASGITTATLRTLTVPDADGTLALTSGLHAATTLDANAETLLSLSSQEIGLDMQTANYGLFGPATGVPAVPTFRAMVAADIPSGIVSLAKLADLAQDQFIGRTTASTGVPETATITAAARTVLDDATVAAMVNTLGGASSTGTDGLVRATSPSLVTPDIGAALGDSLSLDAGGYLRLDGTVGTGAPLTGIYKDGSNAILVNILYGSGIFQGRYEMRFNSFAPTNAITLGTAALPWSDVYIGRTGSTGFIDMAEYNTTTDAAAPSADHARLYVRDNGAGKEQLVVRFATGAVQVLATEP